MGSVVHLTTMWNKVRKMEVAEKLEADLKRHSWNTMIDRGATVGRFYANDPKSIWQIVDEMVQRHY
jgi:hypothetical protein